MVATDPSTVAPTAPRPGRRDRAPEHTDSCGERPDNAIRSQSRKSGADEKYLVAGVIATKECFTEPDLKRTTSEDLLIPKFTLLWGDY